MTPSEYWQRQCYVGASSVSRAETDLRYEIGVDHMMFGSDYPHVEGTWPRTYDWIRATLGGIPVDEQRAHPRRERGALYGFDLDVLDAIAQRVGHPRRRPRRARRQPRRSRTRRSTARAPWLDHVLADVVA